MVYSGNSELSLKAQERVITAFRQAVVKLQGGQLEEAAIGLDFVLRLDPTFVPAVNLRQQLRAGGGEIDLGDVIAHLQAPSTEAIDELLVEAVESFNQRDFLGAKEKVEQVLMELPGHQEARQLRHQIDDALKIEGQVGQFLARAREALDQGDPEEAANFVMMAQALDPHHAGIAPTLQEIYQRGGAERGSGPADTVSFETSDVEGDRFAVRFDDLPEVPDAPEPLLEQAAAPDRLAPPAADAGRDAFWGGPPALDLEQAAVEPATLSPDAGLFAASAEPAAMAASDDISDLFEEEPHFAPAAAQAATARPGETVDSLIQRGEVAFQSGDDLVAIDAWSRVWLHDPANHEVEPLIEGARRRLEELERRAEHLMFDAQEASLSLNLAQARKLANEALALLPRHAPALDLLRRLDSAGAAAVQAARSQTMPDLEEDLFEDRAAVVAQRAAAEELAEEWPAAPAPARRILGLSVRTLALLGGGALVVAVGLWLARGVVFGPGSSGPVDVYRLRDQAELLFKEGRVQEALQLVRDVPSSDPTERQILERLIAKYQKALAPPTPTPIPAALTAARALWERGLLFHAYAEVAAGLRRFPDDRALLELRRLIEDHEPQAAVLQSALDNNKLESAVGIASDLLARYPGQADLREVLERTLFNAALAELRVYNLAGAENFLQDYDRRHPDDEVVDRILEFIALYKARPVDMTLQVFIASLEIRQRRSLLDDGPPVEGPSPAATGTPAPTAAAESG